MENNFEVVPEHIPTKGEVMEVIARFAENTKEVRTLSDDSGPYLIEVEKEGEKAGETIQYVYMRKGEFPNRQSTTETELFIIYLEDGIPVGGNTLTKL